MPNGPEKQLNFIAKVRDPQSKEFKPLYIAPDATDDVQGDVFLSDTLDENLDAAEGMTAATPKAVYESTKNKLDKATSETQNVASEVVFDGGVTVSGDNFKVGEYQADGTFKDGTIPLKYIPQGALERLVMVQDEAARFALTKEQVQLGDSVKQTDNDTVYMVVDEDNLDNENGYVEYSGGTARRLGTETIGSPIRPVYIDEGYATPVKHVLGVDVPDPDNAVKNGDFWTFEDDGITRVEMSDIVKASDDIAKNGNSSSYWSKYRIWMQSDHTFYMHMNDGANGAQNIYGIRIIGMNNDIKTGGGNAGLTFMLKNKILNQTYAMNSTAINNRGWEGTELRANMNSGTIYSQIPDSIKEVLVSVDKKSHNATGKDTTALITTTSDKLWIPSYCELITPGTMSTSFSAYPYLSQEGSQYDFFGIKNVRHVDEQDSNQNNAVLTLRTPSATATGWWMRSCSPYDSNGFIYVYARGDFGLRADATTNLGIAFCFCLSALSHMDKKNSYLNAEGKWKEINVNLPIASSTTLGGIKVGDNLTIDNDGILNAKGESIPYITYQKTSAIIEVTVPEFEDIKFLNELSGKLFILDCLLSENLQGSTRFCYLNINQLSHNVITIGQNEEGPVYLEREDSFEFFTTPKLLFWSESQDSFIVVGGDNSSTLVDNATDLLPITKGGTGNDLAARVQSLSENTGVLVTSKDTDLVYLKPLSEIQGGGSVSTDNITGILPVSKGGTGRSNVTSTALLYGDGTASMKEVSNRAGALYKATASSIPLFGTLPVAQGGTGKTSLTKNGILYASGTSTLAQTDGTSTGALHKTSASGAPTFGTLPISMGGTGATTAAEVRSNLGLNYVDKKYFGHIINVQNFSVGSNKTIIEFFNPLQQGDNEVTNYYFSNGNKTQWANGWTSGDTDFICPKNGIMICTIYIDPRSSISSLDFYIQNNKDVIMSSIYKSGNTKGGTIIMPVLEGNSYSFYIQGLISFTADISAFIAII